ncbi:hypothetical protein OCU04_006059 [Sclerotinia nivalis]|uniref:Uncharacterized protein n=1 Tax=Sclerotinia nivalis TaxID=352851 RepID=A0A9X0DJ08_9HELO|nr:hypothetical protein OCU04_006059 [Sclerotinia nivalis]
MSLHPSFAFQPRSSSLPLRTSSKSRSTPHLSIPRKKCIYLLTTYTCSHFVRPFTNPTNIIHTSTCIARYGGMCSSEGYRYEFLGNGGEICEDCRLGRCLKEKNCENERKIETETGVEGEIGGNVEDDEREMMDSRQSMDNAMLSNINEQTGTIESDGCLTATEEFLLKESRSFPDIGTDRRSMSRNRRSKRMMTFESQRALPTRRPTIGEHKHVSIVIEEGQENDKDKCGISNVRCVVSQGKKRWENLWGKLKKL